MWSLMWSPCLSRSTTITTTCTHRLSITNTIHSTPATRRKIESASTCPQPPQSSQKCTIPKKMSILVALMTNWDTSSPKMTTTIIRERPASTLSTPMSTIMTATMLKEGINAILVENINLLSLVIVVKDIVVTRDVMVVRDMVILRDAVTIKEEWWEREESMRDAVTMMNTLKGHLTMMIMIGCRCQSTEECWIWLDKKVIKTRCQLHQLSQSQTLPP